MNLVNLTPHPVTIVKRNGERVTVESSGLARVQSASGAYINYPGLEEFTLEAAPVWGNVTGLPEPQVNTVYIVSLLVLEALRRNGEYRPDVFGPGTGPNDGAIRENGQIVAVTKLIQA